MSQILAQSIVPKYAPIASRLFYESNIDNAEGMGEDLHMVFAAHAHTLRGTYPTRLINSETRLGEREGRGWGSGG